VYSHVLVRVRVCSLVLVRVRAYSHVLVPVCAYLHVLILVRACSHVLVRVRVYLHVLVLKICPFRLTIARLPSQNINYKQINLLIGQSNYSVGYSWFLSFHIYFTKKLVY